MHEMWISRFVFGKFLGENAQSAPNILILPYCFSLFPKQPIGTAIRDRLYNFVQGVLKVVRIALGGEANEQLCLGAITISGRRANY